ncbi:NHL repeat-containing protein [bacterium]|nr:NHL repeat-containing protein [bacterium]
MKVVKLYAILLFLIFYSLLATQIVLAQGIREAIEVLDKGIDLYQNEKDEEAATEFTSAEGKFKELIDGVISPEDRAYSQYYKATALYYLGRIKNDVGFYDDASAAFGEAITGFKGIDLLGEEYIRSKYLRALCSFRKYEMERVERNQRMLLEESIGDFLDFLGDDALKGTEDYNELIENAKYMIGYSLYNSAQLDAFRAATLSKSKKSYQDAIGYLKELGDAENEELSIAAKILESQCHYGIARLYMRVDEIDWSRQGLASGDKNPAIDSELKTAITLAEDAMAKAVTYQDLKTQALVCIDNCKIALGSLGDKTNLNDAVSSLTDLRDNPTWKNVVLEKIADSQLLHYLIFEGTQGNVITNYGRIASSFNESNYWIGWAHYIVGEKEYDDAILKYNQFLASIPAFETRYKELEADAKFRLAESFFWKGVRENNVQVLKRADELFKALIAEDGRYYEYLTRQQIGTATTRIFLIDVESTLGGEADVDLFESVMELAGLELPDNAEDYIEAGKYFLEKGIQTAEVQRENALKFAQKAFELVLDASVSAEIKNKAQFLKGVTQVKLATLYEDDKQNKTLEQARSTLSKCTSPYNNESKYVEGISYFIANDYTQAAAVFGSLKNRGHIRGAFYYALSNPGNCNLQGETFLQIQKTVKDRADYWYRSADLELSKLTCRGSLGSADAFSSTIADPPITYEKLVDKKAEEGRKKNEARLIWQKASAYQTLYPIEKLITDKPPKTNVTVRFIVEPGKGDEELLIDGNSDLAQSVDDSKYKAEVTRGSHDVAVKKKGFYLWEGQFKVTKPEDFYITLKKAVKYTKSEDIGGSAQPIEIVKAGDDVFVVNSGMKEITRFSDKGESLGKISFSSLGIAFCTGLGVDGSKLIIVDGRRNKIISADLDGSNIEYIAYENEEYGTKPLNKPSDIAVSEGMYYIVDSGNKRVLVFEGSTFRREFGKDNLQEPHGIALNPVTSEIYVTDWAENGVVIFDKTGEYSTTVKLPEQPHANRILIDEAGYVYIADLIENSIKIYNSKLETISDVVTNIHTPRGMALVGSGPEAILFVAGKDKVAIYKGSWDNVYMVD